MNQTAKRLARMCAVFGVRAKPAPDGIGVYIVVSGKRQYAANPIDVFRATARNEVRGNRPPVESLYL